jgi:hypothetical protein
MAGVLCNVKTSPLSTGASSAMVLGSVATTIGCGTSALGLAASPAAPTYAWRRALAPSSLSSACACKSSESETAKNSSTSAAIIAVHSHAGRRRRETRAWCTHRNRHTLMPAIAINAQRILSKDSIFPFQPEPQNRLPVAPVGNLEVEPDRPWNQSNHQCTTRLRSLQAIARRCCTGSNSP